MSQAVTIEERAVRFEMKEDGLYCWRKHTRKKHRLSFVDVWASANGQASFRFETAEPVKIQQRRQPAEGPTRSGGVPQGGGR